MQLQSNMSDYPAIADPTISQNNNFMAESRNEVRPVDHVPALQNPFSKKEEKQEIHFSGPKNPYNWTEKLALSFH